MTKQTRAAALLEQAGIVLEAEREFALDEYTDVSDFKRGDAPFMLAQDGTESSSRWPERTDDFEPQRVDRAAGIESASAVTYIYTGDLPPITVSFDMGHARKPATFRYTVLGNEEKGTFADADDVEDVLDRAASDYERAASRLLSKLRKFDDWELEDEELEHLQYVSHADEWEEKSAHLSIEDIQRTFAGESATYRIAYTKDGRTVEKEAGTFRDLKELKAIFKKSRAKLVELFGTDA